jgi:diadenylate cyclase
MTLMILTFINLHLIDVLDILLVAGLLYVLYYLLRGTVAINIFLGIVSIFLIWRLVTLFGMELLSEILGAFVSVGFIALIIIFQPEIRQFLLALGTPRFIRKHRRRFSILGFRFSEEEEFDLAPIVRACVSMAEKNTGALIVVTRQNSLFQYVSTGVELDAGISQPLIENIFFKNSPLHDGAMIIQGQRIKAAGCILPVTKKLDLPGRPGLRHRAALGITEQSDAIGIVISEERGSICVTVDGSLHPMPNGEALAAFLKAELLPAG